MTQKDIYHDILKDPKAVRLICGPSLQDENNHVKNKEIKNFINTLTDEEQTIRILLFSEVEDIASGLEQASYLFSGIICGFLSIVVPVMAATGTDRRGDAYFHAENLLSLSWVTYVIVGALLTLSISLFLMRNSEVKKKSQSYPERIARIKNNSVLKGIIDKANSFRTIEDYGF